MIATLGSISHATMRTEDLIPIFTNTLEQLDTDKTYTDLINDARAITDFNGEDAYYILNERLFNALNTFSPPYCYFGGHPGDGSDYGFWIDEYVNEVYEGLKVSDLCEVPDNYTGELMFINDHGNMTLYNVTKGKLKEVWSIV